MSKDKISIGIAGSGAMGLGIAQVAASNGCDVILYDINKQALEKAREKLSSNLDQLVIKNKMGRVDADSIKERITYIESLNNLGGCSLIIEAVVEKLDVKQQLFIELEKIIATDCILASNTSSLSITAIAGACSVPSRVIGMHFFNPAPLMPLVEIIPGLVTSEQIVQNANRVISSWGKTTVIAKDTPGFIVNRIARPFYGEAIRIYEENIADLYTIDCAMKDKGGFRMGPFELMDFIGNDVNYAVSETVWQQLFFDPRYKPSITQKRLVEARRFGRKSGRGYYDYSDAVSSNNEINEAERDKYIAIFQRIICMLFNEAIDAVYLGIASKEDIDLAMTKGVNYPAGLLKWADEYGLEKVLQTMEQLHDDYSEERYRPSFLLRKMVKKNLKFYNS